MINANELDFEDQKKMLLLKQQELMGNISLLGQKLDYYETEGMPIYDRFVQNALKTLSAGEVSIFEFTQMMQSAYAVNENYLKTLLEYNLEIVSANYITIP